MTYKKNTKPLDKYDDPIYAAAFKEGWFAGYDVGFNHAYRKAKQELQLKQLGYSEAQILKEMTKEELDKSCSDIISKFPEKFPI